MAYKKIGFRDRIDSNPTTYFINGDSKEIIKDDSGVSVEGTSLNASNFNHLEDGILQNSRDVEVINKTIGDTSNLETQNKVNLVGAINEVFTDVDNGKKGIYGAIVDKGTTPSSQNFKDLEAAIKNIKTGEGTAQAKDVLEGKTFTNDNGTQIGTMKNNGEKKINPSKNVQALDDGYYKNLQVNAIDKNVLQSNFPEFKPENIIKDVEIAGVVGTGTAVYIKENEVYKLIEENIITTVNFIYDEGTHQATTIEVFFKKMPKIILIKNLVIQHKDDWNSQRYKRKMAVDIYVDSEKNEATSNSYIYDSTNTSNITCSVTKFKHSNGIELTINARDRYIDNDFDKQSVYGNGGNMVLVF